MNTTQLQTVLDGLVRANIIAIGQIVSLDKILTNPNVQIHHEEAMVLKQGFRKKVDSISKIFQNLAIHKEDEDR